MLVLAVVACLLLVGGAFATRSTQHRAEAAGPATPAGPPSVTAASASAAPSPSASSPTAPSLSPSASASATVPASLTADLLARSAKLRRLVEKAQARSRKRLTAPPVAIFTMASFNLQGATHRGGIAGRTRRAVELFHRHGVDVVALQEFQRPQRQIFSRIGGGTYDVFPATIGRSLDAENSVAWRRDTFELVRGETRPYPYFRGAIRNMPRVLLRDLKTGVTVWVTSYHNPATCCGYGNAAPFRARGVSLEIADANALLATTKDALIVAGDMNDRATYFCKMAGATSMHSADGSTYSGGCRVAPHAWIDWVLGSKDVTFSAYHRDRSSFVRRTSDHPIVLTRVSVKGTPG